MSKDIDIYYIDGYDGYSYEMMEHCEFCESRYSEFRKVGKFIGQILSTDIRPYCSNCGHYLSDEKRDLARLENEQFKKHVRLMAGRVPDGEVKKLVDDDYVEFLKKILEVK